MGIHIALVGDTHDALDEMYHIIAEHEAVVGAPVAAVLQVGDLSAFPDPHNIATRRGLSPGQQLQFVSYHDGSKVAPRPTYFVRGNHEDQAFLAKRRGRPVDKAGRIVQLREGRVVTVGTKARGEVRVAGIGGIEPARVSPEKYAEHAGGRYISKEETAQMLRLPRGSVDILLTHDAPLGLGLRNNPDTGSPAVARVSRHLRPRLHVWGHYHDPPPPTTVDGTRQMCLNRPDGTRLPGRDGCVWILDTTDWSLDSPKSP